MWLASAYVPAEQDAPCMDEIGGQGGAGVNYTCKYQVVVPHNTGTAVLHNTAKCLPHTTSGGPASDAHLEVPKRNAEMPRNAQYGRVPLQAVPRVLVRPRSEPERENVGQVRA